MCMLRRPTAKLSTGLSLRLLWRRTSAFRPISFVMLRK